MGTLSDQQIVDEINNSGYKSRHNLVRDPKDRTKIVKERGNQKLTLKGFWRYLKIRYLQASILLIGQKIIPKKGKFDGLVSIETFNKANRGKITILRGKWRDKNLSLERPPEYLVKKGVQNADFPYKRVVYVSPL